MNKFLTLVILALFSMSVDLRAELKFNSLFAENMVLQQNKPIKIFGTESDKSAKIKIKLGNRSASTTPDKKGNWQVVLKPMKGNVKKLTLVAEVRYKKGKPVIKTIKSISIGDVWIIAGDSSLVNPTIGKLPILKEKLRKTKLPMVSVMALSENLVDTPQTTAERFNAYKDKWHTLDTPGPIDLTSALAFYFGKSLTEKSKIPVGIVHTTSRGTLASWVPEKEYLKAGFKKNHVKERNKLSFYSTSASYNGMIHPLTAFGVKGVIWYNGSKLGKFPNHYGKTLQTLIQSWRQRFNDPNLPFLTIQVASHRGSDSDRSGEQLAWFREAQSQSLKLPNAGLVVTTDIGEYKNMAPMNKHIIASRLALWVDKINKKSPQGIHPVYKKASLNGGRFALEFDNTGSGLQALEVKMNRQPGLQFRQDPEAFVVPKGDAKGFSLAGKDGVFYPAKAKIIRNRILLISEKVKKPVSIRYGWSSFPLCNVFNSSGLPLMPFRTDKLPQPAFDGTITGKVLSLQAAAGAEMTIRPNANASVQVIGGGAGQLIKAIKGKSARVQGFEVPGVEFEKGKIPSLKATIIYFDQGSGVIDVKYDSSIEKVEVERGEHKHAQSAGKIKLTNSQKWMYVTVDIEKAYFGKRLWLADFQLSSLGSDFIVSGVYLTTSK